MQAPSLKASDLKQLQQPALVRSDKRKKTNIGTRIFNVTSKKKASKKELLILFEKQKNTDVDQSMNQLSNQMQSYKSIKL